MKHFNKILFLILLAGNFARAQVLPEPGAVLNYTQVMLEYPKIAGASEYLIEIVEVTEAGSFNYPLREWKDSSTATMISNLRFGRKYVWRYTGLVKGRVSNWKGPYHFEIMDDPFIKDYRVRVIKNDTSKNAGGLICIDGIRSIVDRQGTPVLFVPEVKEISRRGAGVDDLRV